MSITLTLTPEQQAQIAPLLNAIQEMSDQGKPGALVAQVYSRAIKVVLMDNAQGTRFNAAMQAAEVAP